MEQEFVLEAKHRWLVTQKQTTVQLRGLVTQPNRLGLPPGSLQFAENVRFTGENQMEPRAAFVELLQQEFDPDTPDDNPGKLWPVADRVFAASRFHLYRHDPKFPTATPDHIVARPQRKRPEDAPGTVSEEFEFLPGKTQMARARERLIFTEKNGPVVLDALPLLDADGDPQDPLDDSGARAAGLGIPILSFISFSGDGTNPIPDAHTVSYRAVFRKNKESTGYTFWGPVSSPVVIRPPPGETHAPLLQVQWNPHTVPLENGDYVELYRTNAVEDLDTDIAGAPGDVHRLVKSVRLTNSQIASGSITIEDTVDENALGAELYYNEGQEGAAMNHYPPPLSVDAATFQGHVFYVAHETWQDYEVNVAGKLGALTNAAEQSTGLGTRHYTAVFSNAGSDQVIVPASGFLPGTVVGQIVTAGTIGLTGAKITGFIDPNIIIFDRPATITTGGTGQFYVSDVITITPSGGPPVDHTFSSVGTLVEAFGDANAAKKHSVVPVVTADPNAAIAREVGGHITFVVPGNAGPFQISATNGDRYSPPLTSTQTSSGHPARNRVMFSLFNEPEVVPPAVTTLTVGEGEILRLWPTKDLLFVFCTDGVYTIVGMGDRADSGEWTVKPYNLEVVLEYPDAIDAMDNNMFLISNKGFITFSSDEGFKNISEGLIGGDVQRLLQKLREAFRAENLVGGVGVADLAKEFRVWGEYVACDKHLNEVWFCVRKEDLTDISGSFGAIYIYSLTTGSWSTQNDPNIKGPNDSNDQPSYRPTIYHPYFHNVIRSVKYHEGANIPDSLIWYDTRKGEYFDETDLISGSFAPARLIFNPIFWDDPGLMKQWIDVTVFKSGMLRAFGTLPVEVTVTFWSNESLYPFKFNQPTGIEHTYIIPVPFNSPQHSELVHDEWVLPVPRDSVHSKQLQFGLTLPGGPFIDFVPWVIRGLTVRYRTASRALRR